jgi:hypothetical protein
MILVLAFGCVTKPEPWRPDGGRQDGTVDVRGADAVDVRGADATAESRCVASCDGLDCGEDGCGGSCGTCLGTGTCVAGFCVAEATVCEEDEPDKIRWDGCTDGYLSEERVNTYTVEDQMYPDIAAWNDGGWVIVWQSCPIEFYDYQGEYQDGSGCGVYLQLYDEWGNRSGSERRANSSVLYHQHSPSVATFPGGFVVAWLSWSEEPGWQIVLQQFDLVGDKVGGDFVFEVESHQEHWKPHVAAVAAGEGVSILLAWEGQQPGGGLGILGQILTASGDDPDVFLATMGGAFDIKAKPTLAQGYLDLATFGGSRFLAVWEADVGGESQIDVFARVIDSVSGEPEGTEDILIAGNAGYTQGQPAAAALNAGGFACAYLSDQVNPDGYGIMLEVYSEEGDSAGPLYPIANSGGYQNIHPSVGAVHGNTPIVAWERDGDEDYSVDGIYLQILTEDYDKAGQAIKVNVHESQFETHPEISVPVDSDVFMIVWQSCPYDVDNEPLDLPGQDGHGCGVFAEAFTIEGERL